MTGDAPSSARLASPLSSSSRTFVTSRLAAKSNAVVPSPSHPSGFFVRDDVTQLERILRKSRTRKAALVPGKRQRRSSAASTVLKEESPSNEAVAGPSRGQPPPDDPSRAQWPPTASGSGPRPNDLPLPPTSYLPPLPGNLYAPPPPQAYYSNPSLTYFNSSVYSPVPTQHFSPDFSLRNPAPLSPLDPHFLPSHSPKTHDPTRFLPSHSPKIHEPPLAPLPRDPTDYYAPRTVYSYQEGRNQLDEAVEQNSRIDPYLVGVRAGANVNYYAQPKSSLGIYAEAR